ncbi:hypothetical protein [Aequorivita sp. KMM 9714]|uniref:hypothetical protein n=1 Tax=Aequorivita sp. KMM 9714 TaxID=2707173 RepID=UPI0013EDAD05|nr:hypothetical protein [Aequorivita sp. KMM 9714]NGX85278.1 hypothetical protein [Aequorivita sp. KMM 9714]
MAVAHGSIYGTDGNSITPSEDFILGVQEYYIKSLLKNLKKSDPKTERRLRGKINNLVTNKVLANALFLDWLLEKEQRVEVSNIEPINNALRLYYITNIQKNPILPTEDVPWAKGIETDIAFELELEGLDKFENLDVFIEPVESGPKYIQDCIDAGVPVPNKLFDSTWVKLGRLEKYAETERKRELFIYRSLDPPGFCIAMISNAINEYESGHYDLICFGTQSNNACFFERDGLVYNESNLVGEFNEELDVNDVDNRIITYCTRCHAGENPFIVHPEDPVFIEAAKLKRDFLDTPNTLPNLMGTDWYNPMFNHAAVTETYEHVLGNPPPPLLSPIAFVESEKKCTSCHSKDGTGGRFPYRAPVEYCSIFDTSIGSTMPLYDQANTNKYINEINQLKKYICDQSIGGGGEVLGD